MAALKLLDNFGVRGSKYLMQQRVVFKTKDPFVTGDKNVGAFIFLSRNSAPFGVGQNASIHDAESLEWWSELRSVPQNKYFYNIFEPVKPFSLVYQFEDNSINHWKFNSISETKNKLQELDPY
jgi:hypothetical protein